MIKSKNIYKGAKKKPWLGKHAIFQEKADVKKSISPKLI